MSFETRKQNKINDLRRKIETEGACSPEDAEIFYPEDKTGEYKEECIERAKKRCGECSVEDFCLRFALITREQFGIWGGKTSEERKSIDRTNARRARGRSLDDTSA